MERKFYREKLKNGMVLVFERRDSPVVSVAFAVRAGGAQEKASEKGISHFMEHMFYKGTPTRTSKEIADDIERKGGELNGFTDELLTAFWCRMPSKHIATALNVLSDMMRNPIFDPKEIEKEKQVIFQEIKLHRDNPISYALEGIHKSLFLPPFGLPLIGDEKTLGSFNREKLVRKFKEIYQPNNMILCVVGDADFSRLKRFAEKTFPQSKGKIPNFKIKEKNSTKVEKRVGIDQANLIFATHIPKSGNKKNYAAFVLNVLMAGGMSSRLFSEIREKRNLAYGVSGDCTIQKDFAYSYIYVGTQKEKVSEVKRLILEEFRKVSKELGEKELGEVKEQIVGNAKLSAESSHDQMVRLLIHEINGNAKALYEFEKNIRAVKLKDVMAEAEKAARKYSFFALVSK